MSPIVLFGQNANLGQVVQADLDADSFSDPLPTYDSRCLGPKNYDKLVISRFREGDNKVRIVMDITGGTGFRPGSEGYIKITNPDYKITKIYDHSDYIGVLPPSVQPTDLFFLHNDYSGFGRVVDMEEGSISWQGRGTCPACACRENYFRMEFLVEKVGSTSSVSLVDAIDTSGTSWTTGGNVNWFGQTFTSYHDGDAAQSGLISHSQNSWLQTTGIWVFPGTWSFYWKVSSEENGDWLEFYIDDVIRDRISGTVDWQQESYSISSGSHTLKWQYVKDGGIDSESDCGWVDNVEFSPETSPTTPLFYVDKVATSSEVAYTELIWNPSGITNYYGYEVHLTNPNLVVSTSNDYKIGYFAPIEYEEENLVGTLVIWAGTTAMDLALGGPYLSFLQVVYVAFHNEDKDVHKVDTKEFLREEIIRDHVHLFVDSNNEVRFITQIVSDTPTQNWQIHVSGSIDYDYVWDSTYQGRVVDPPSRHGTLSKDEVITLIE
jgi:hypothetical protein